MARLRLPRQCSYSLVLQTHTTAAWVSNSTEVSSPPFSASSPRLSKLTDSSEVQSTAATSLPKVKELSGDSLGIANSDLSALIEGIDTLRMYVSLEELPFALLEELSAQLEGGGDLKEMNICITSSLRPVLQAIHESIGLERGLTFIIRKWENTSTTLKFFFFLPQPEGTHDRMDFKRYQEADLTTAIHGLVDGSAELSEVLAVAEGRARAAKATLSGSKIGAIAGNEMVDTDEYL
jgi:hypothetical protein